MYIKGALKIFGKSLIQDSNESCCLSKHLYIRRFYLNQHKDVSKTLGYCLSVKHVDTLYKLEPTTIVTNEKMQRLLEKNSEDGIVRKHIEYSSWYILGFTTKYIRFVFAVNC